MIYFFYGDSPETRKAFLKMRETLSQKQPDAGVFAFNEENFSPAILEEYISGQGLFYIKYIVSFANLFETEHASELINKLPEMQKASHVFLIRERRLSQKICTQIEKYAEKVWGLEKKRSGREGKGDSPNVFLLADAVGKRNKKEAWTLFVKMHQAGISPEELHGVIFWQIKSMALAEKAQSSSEAGLSPFVFQKSKRFSKNFTSEELQNLLSRLVSIYHESREGGPDLKISLEIFVLDV